METVKVKLFIHKDFIDDPIVSTTDLRSCGFPLLGTHEVEVPLPEVDAVEAVEAEIDALYEQAGAIEAEASEKVLALREKASKLQKSRGCKGE